MHTIFANDMKYLSALGAYHVTIIGSVVDKLSVSSLINLRTCLNVLIVTIGHFSSFPCEISGVEIQNNCKTEETLEEIHYSF